MRFFKRKQIDSEDSSKREPSRFKEERLKKRFIEYLPDLQQKGEIQQFEIIDGNTIYEDRWGFDSAFLKLVGKYVWVAPNIHGLAIQREIDSEDRPGEKVIREAIQTNDNKEINISNIPVYERGEKWIVFDNEEDYKNFLSFVKQTE